MHSPSQITATVNLEPYGFKLWSRTFLGQDPRRRRAGMRGSGWDGRRRVGGMMWEGERVKGNRVWGKGPLSGVRLLCNRWESGDLREWCGLWLRQKVHLG